MDKPDRGSPRRRLLALLLPRLWAGPTTLIGIAAALASLSVPRRSGPVLLCRSSRGFARWFLLRRGYHAIALGHLVLMVEEASIDLLPHEMVHVRQGERWGPLFIPAYLAAMVVLRVRGRDPYHDNPFEVEARREGGG